MYVVDDRRLMRNIIIIASKGQGTRFVFRRAKRIWKSFPSRVKRFFELKRYPKNEQNCCDYLNKETNAIAVFFSHGNEKEICGWCGGGRRKLIKYPDTYQVLKGLSVATFSCSSARILGRKAVEDGVVNVFFGFDTDISWEGFNIQEFKTYLGKIIEKTLGDAIRKRENFEQFSKNLDLDLKRNIKHEFPRKKIELVMERFEALKNAIYCGGNKLETF